MQVAMISAAALPKSPTGVPGSDDITLGGLPTGRPTLICGAAGCGKTLFAASFLVNGATRFGEPDVFMCFEERAEDLAANFASLGYDLDRLIEAGSLAIDHVRVERNEIEEAGDYDLEGLFVRLGFAVDSIGAKRVVLDTIESLFSGFTNFAILRAELRRLFDWIKNRGLTAIITGERGDGQLTRHGLEEYISDCVILLDNRVVEQIATRRLRIVKYRGSAHGSNEYPFLIDTEGFSVLPVTSSGRNRPVSNEIVSSGISGLDAMLRNGGFYRGSSILVSGVSGTGKTNIGSHFIDAACRRGERCTFLLFEEGSEEVCRNSLSIGLNLRQWVDAGLLRLEATRPSVYGLEMHLVRIHRDLQGFRPSVVVIDPISAFRGPASEVHTMLLRLVDLLKSMGITALFTTLHSAGSVYESDDQTLSSLMDSWIKLVAQEANGEHNRVLYVIKSRGTSHSNQVREYRMSDTGIELIEAYIGPEGVLTGTARLIQEAREREAAERRRLEIAQRRRELARRYAAREREIAELQTTIEAEQEEARMLMMEAEVFEKTQDGDREAFAASRRAGE